MRTGEEQQEITAHHMIIDDNCSVRCFQRGNQDVDPGHRGKEDHVGL